MKITHYVSSRGEKTLIAEMANPHLIHSIAKLARSLGIQSEKGEVDVTDDQEEMLVALKAEAIERLSEANPE